MKPYIIDNFLHLLEVGIQIVNYPQPAAYLRIEKNVISVFTDTFRKTYNIHDIDTIRYNSRHYTISMLFKNAEKIVVRLLTKRSLRLFYKYFIMLLDYKQISVKIEDVL